MSNRRLTVFVTSLALLGIPHSANAGAITLINDSAFPLKALISNATGQQQGSISLTPGQSYIWMEDDGSFRELANATTTPYTVRWICNAGRPFDYSTQARKKGEKVPPKYQSEFGAWEAVPATATITAQGCTSGQKTCVIKKSQQQSKQQPLSRVHPKPARHPNERKPGFANEGNGNFSNDGGLTWNNDGNSPSADFSNKAFQEGDDEEPSSEVNTE